MEAGGEGGGVQMLEWLNQDREKVGSAGPETCCGTVGGGPLGPWLLFLLEEGWASRKDAV